MDINFVPYMFDTYYFSEIQINLKKNQLTEKTSLRVRLLWVADTDFQFGAVCKMYRHNLKKKMEKGIQ